MQVHTKPTVNERLFAVAIALLAAAALYVILAGVASDGEVRLFCGAIAASAYALTRQHQAALALDRAEFAAWEARRRNKHAVHRQAAARLQAQA